MAILQILQYPDTRLRRKGYTVTDVQSPEVQKIIDDIYETLAATKHCAGLSATQLAIDPAPSITVINPPLPGETPWCLINPKIIAASGSQIGEEGCMSVCPDMISAKVERYAHVKVTALDRSGKTVTIDADEILAVCLQHEIDHLNGILYIDHLSPLKRSRIEKKIAKLATRN